MTQDQLDQTVYSFIAAFAFDAEDSANPPQIYAGYQNFGSPPALDYIVFTMISSESRERGMEWFRWGGSVVAANLRHYTYQIMCAGEKGRARLQRLLQVWGAGIGAGWLRKYTTVDPLTDTFGGVAPIRTGPVMDMSEQGGTGQYEYVYTADFTLAARLDVEIEQGWAEAIEPITILAGTERIVE